MVPICYYDQINIQPLILNPKSRGRVTINSTSPFDQPLIYPNYFRDSRDIDTMIDSFKFVQKLKDSSVLKNAGYIVNDTFLPRRKDLETGGNPYWKVVPRIASFSICHPCCTCKMGPSNDPGSVVDPHLRVHGIQHLRVVDGSIMPTIPSGPTNAAIIMIAEKVSDMIKNTWI
ncbi:Glucose dehydrogenase [FAD, quinone] [Blattella germanica]|nr:Glucose dehydrogenase [FAD, quinone] [Blattella germanica]